MADKTSPATRDMLVARAIDRVLGAERAARAQVENCEAQARDLLERARQQRHALMERARVRIVSIHSRVAHAIESGDARSQEQQQKRADESSAHLEAQTPVDAALARLAQRLTSGES